MNKRGFSDKDILNWIKVAIAAVIAYLVVRALFIAIS